MQIYRTSFVCLIFIIKISTAYCAEIMLNVDKTLCTFITSAYEVSIQSCKKMPSECVLEALQKSPEYFDMYRMQLVSQDHYGYSEIYKADLTGNDNQFTLLHLRKFNGSRHTNTQETWLVSTSQFANLLDMLPGPIEYKNNKYDIYVNNSDIQDVLLKGEKISDNFVHVWKHEGRDVFVENTYGGEGVGGGDFRDDRIYRVVVYEALQFNKYKPLCHIELSHNL